MNFTPDAYSRSVEGELTPALIDELAAWMHPRVFRETFAAPGFALAAFSCGVDSHELRRIMVELKRTLSDLHRRASDRELCYCSMGRFDQQTSTRFHLDGAPEQSFLMLGYEPTPVESRLAMADYSRAAFDLNISPAEYLEQYNPMFAAHETRLTGYISPLAAFDHRRPQILCVNNSRQPFDAANRHQLGVFHQATIPEPRTELRRIVNSTMIGVCPDLGGETVSADDQLRFVETDQISGSRYN